MKNNDKSLQFQVKLPVVRLADSEIIKDVVSAVCDCSDVIELLRADNRNNFKIVSIANTDIKGLDWASHLKDLDDESLAFVLEEIDTLQDEDMLVFQAALIQGEKLYRCLDVANYTHYTIYNGCYSLEDVIEMKIAQEEDIDSWLIEYLNMPKYIEEVVKYDGCVYQQVEDDIWVCYWN